MAQAAWTLDRIREALAEHEVEPRLSLEIPSEDAERLRIGRWRVLTVAPGEGSAVQVWEVDEAELMWLMLRCIEASEFIISVSPALSEAQGKLDRMLS